jgi:hypothetical protein
MVQDNDPPENCQFLSCLDGSKCRRTGDFTRSNGDLMIHSRKDLRSKARREM